MTYLFCIFRVGILLSVSFTILQNADISSPRNLFIYGISMFAGLALPAYLGDNPNAINTGDFLVFFPLQNYDIRRITFIATIVPLRWVYVVNLHPLLV